MKIRSITGFIHPLPENCAARFDAIASILHEARRLLIGAGFAVQTLRVALPEVRIWSASFPKPFDAVLEFERHTERCGIDYLSIGPLDPAGGLAPEHAPALLERTTRVFTSVSMTADDGVLLRRNLPEFAQTICALGTLPPASFATLRFCVNANCPANIPFFPAAFAQPDEFAFALAMECADLALSAAAGATHLEAAQQRLSESIEAKAGVIEALLQPLSTQRSAHFHGCDWSLAPHPDEACSIGAALEKLSGAPFGEFGTLSALATLTRGVKTARVKHVGFSGAFLPLLEDARLAARTSEGRVDLNKLLLYSTVCGSGLDTIPLPGDVKPEALAPLLADLGTLALAHHKPLTARFMPVAGLQPGQSTQFDFPFLVNARCLNVHADAPGLFS